jgi:predicted lipoprotein with Yx(FWY)xxD motif
VRRQCRDSGDAENLKRRLGHSRRLEEQPRRDPVNSTGRTLYLFKADVGTQSACTSTCTTKWPPLLATGKPTAGAGLTASELATITRSDGTRHDPIPLFTGFWRARRHDPDTPGTSATARMRR